MRLALLLMLLAACGRERHDAEKDAARVAGEPMDCEGSTGAAWRGDGTFLCVSWYSQTVVRCSDDDREPCVLVQPIRAEEAS